MALDQAIRAGKEHRRPYRGSRSFDAACRNHGGCSWCMMNRTYQQRKLLLAARQEKRDAETDPRDGE